MAQFITVAADIESTQKALAGTSKSLKSIRKQALTVISKGTVKAIKSAIRDSDLSKGTGELLKAYRYKVNRSANTANVFPKALNSDSTIYPKVMTLSYGHSGPTKRADNWTIKPRCFVQSGKAYLEGSAYQKSINDLIEKQLKKYWG